MQSVGHIPNYLQILLSEMGFESVGSFRSLDDDGMRDIIEDIEIEMRNFPSRDSSDLIRSIEAEIARYRKTFSTFSMPKGHRAIIKTVRNVCVMIGREKPFGTLKRPRAVSPMVVKRESQTVINRQEPQVSQSLPNISQFTPGIIRAARADPSTASPIVLIKSDEQIQENLIRQVTNAINKHGNELIKSKISDMRTERTHEGFFICCPMNCRKIKAQIKGKCQRVDIYNYVRHVMKEHGNYEENVSMVEAHYEESSDEPMSPPAKKNNLNMYEI